MLRQVRHGLAKTSLRSPLVWMRHRDFTPNDVFVGSYPRCGSTWLRFMLNELLVGQASGFKNVNEALPDVGKHNRALPVLPGNGRLIKTHEPFRREYKKAIYLVRDCRDVMLSEFAYQKALGFAQENLDGYIRPFLQGKVNPFGSWKNHVQSWLDARDSGRADILLVRFEDLRGNSEEPLAEILSFLGRPAPLSKIREAMENNAVERMREKEKISPQRASARGRFIGNGSVGGWRGKLTDQQNEIVEKQYSDILDRLGYITASEGKVA
jgi:hypothetical protein